MSRAAAGAALLCAAALAVGPGSASAAAPAAAGPVAVIVVVSGPDFEDVMSVPGLQRLAAAGGAALLSPRTVSGDEGPGHELTLGTGTRSAVPFADVEVEGTGERRRVVGFDRIVGENGDRSTPGLLGSVLAEHGLSACGLGPGTALPAADRQGVSPAGSGCEVRFVGFELPGSSEADRRAALGRLASVLPALVPAAPRVLLVLVAPAPSPAMDRVRDEVTPIVMVEGPPEDLLTASGPMHTLTSDTTRRDGLVSNEDVAPTILRFFGIPVPAEMNGSPIRVVSDAGPPVSMHLEHLQNRRIATPVALAALAWVVLGGVACILLIARRRRVPPRVGRIAAVVPLSVAPIAIAYLAAGRLGSQASRNVVPFLVVMVAGAALLGLEFRRYGPLVPAAVVGGASLAYLVVDALQGWPDTPFTLLGGTALDGARFYGMPNNLIGIALGGALFVAATLQPWTGFCLLVATGLFVGFPDLGSNLGGALTVFVAAGLWWGLRTAGRLRWRDVAVTTATVAGGMGAVFAAHAWLTSTATHGTRFVEGRGGRSPFDTLAERIGTGAGLIARSPLTWLILVGLPVVLVVALRPPPVLRGAFERWPPWRASVLALLLAGIVAFVVNDTGVAAAGFCFGLGLAGLVYLPLVEVPWGVPEGAPG
ncbi:MAG TPA: hypothetical protein VGB19_05185 [Actinomycetota bacterium]